MSLLGPLSAAVAATALCAALYWAVRRASRIAEGRRRGAWALSRLRHETRMLAAETRLDREERWLVELILGNVAHYESVDGLKVNYFDLHKMASDTSRERELFVRRLRRVTRETTHEWLRAHIRRIPTIVRDLATVNTAAIALGWLWIRIHRQHAAERGMQLLRSAMSPVPCLAHA